MQITDKISKLFKQVRRMLGEPIRPVQLTDDQMCALLETAVGNYAEKVQNWVVQFNWLNLMGKNGNTFIQNPQEMAFAMSMRSLDYTKDFSYLFSKDVGLQQRGPYELKKDFIQVEKGKQCYVIPAGREINKVLWVTPSTTKAALYGNLGTLDTGIAGGYGQFGNMGYGMGLTGFYVGSAYDTALLAADLHYKNSLLRGDLVYKVTAGPNGTHILHLLSTPGSPNMVGGVAADDTWGWNRYANCYVWYTYYDLSNGTDEDVDECRRLNKDDILITPDQVPLDEMDFELFNAPTQQTVRRLFYAECCLTLALIRGYASGTVKIPDAEMQLDYQTLLDLGKNEKEAAFTELKDRLEAMLPWNLMKNYSDMNASMMENLKLKPFGQIYAI